MSNFIEKLGELVIIFLVVGLPALLIFGKPYFRRWADLKEKQLDSETRLAAEKAAQYATANTALEQRVRVLEQIVTDQPARLAREIDGLALGNGGHA